MLEFLEVFIAGLEIGTVVVGLVWGLVYLVKCVLVNILKWLENHP